ENIADIIKNMQQQTRANGVNLIVCPVETDDVPYDEVPFKCFLQPGELEQYYHDWEVIKQ
ncbi:hypothetical protein, partial [Pseudomonas marginalis]|uniref:hypothetical protein n=1 Tax=Pseudomonas marginalis TaxID=298 RepID=UPI003B00943A